MKTSYATRDQKLLGARSPVWCTVQAILHTFHTEKSFGTPTCLSAAYRGSGPCLISTSHPGNGRETVCKMHLVLKNGWIHRNAQNLHVEASHHQKWMDWGRSQSQRDWLMQQSNYLLLQHCVPETDIIHNYQLNAASIDWKDYHTSNFKAYKHAKHALIITIGP